MHLVNSSSTKKDNAVHHLSCTPVAHGFEKLNNTIG